ncbi:MAG: 16S rRNA (adenine(1518)-N(6)/adenine(1519)-N(6))-dimethyltransferase RsmA [Alphaproteobacteria bacterium]|nr:16S rRNA (adenine(1518)-N(6)/adenine(1519)-N(6))-dimethyltransferase RsmA [Alphaproteobacteria bacterium]MBQ9235277.1 16S rRNA (adenine(1518)-N(6)/adenine(1519)-N(6))-dimethyltransferase RsmA [Alphaproteobacteria bacterium]
MSIADIISSLPSLKLTIEAYGLMAQKSLGQNFLLDSNITDKIVRSSLRAQNLPSFADACLFEVGSGPTGLTRSILKAEPQKLTVIELDERCIKIAEDIRARVGDRLEIVNQDALTYDFTAPAAAPKHILSNLPYNISVPLLSKWLADIGCYKSLTLMFQKEVAERLMASTKTKDYGRLSVLTQLQCRITHLFDLPPEAFTPAPKIWSSVLLLQPVIAPLSREEIAHLEKITALAFSKRRKMLRQTFKHIADFADICEQIGIVPTSRPEELTPQQFFELSQSL